jgi:hypothetical protein
VRVNEMLDLRGLVVTPGAGATLTLGVAGALAVGDGASVAGVPLAPDATMVGFGYLSPIADFIARVKISSQDMVDPINGWDDAWVAAGNGRNGYFQYINVPYKTGQRQLQASTITGVLASPGFTIDAYAKGTCVAGSRRMPGMIRNMTWTVFGGALVSNQWGAVAYAPVNPLPNGKYAILGASIGATTNNCVIRFSHTDFGGLKPGFPIFPAHLAPAATSTLVNDNQLWYEDGFQFVAMGRELGIACCPVFTVGVAGTGLTIEVLDYVADTPTVRLTLVKVG